jgi:hypothetical protein
MTASTTTGGAPLIVGLGGTLRANSSTERALDNMPWGCINSADKIWGDMLATQVLTFAQSAWETT